MMFDQLVESRNTGGEKKRLGGFLASVSSAAFLILTSGLMYSLFAYNLDLGNGDLELSSLVSPIAAAEVKPEPKTEPERARKETSAKAASDIPTRRGNIQSADESPVSPPKNISTAPNQNAARPKGVYKIGDKDSFDDSATGPARDQDTDGGAPAQVARKKEPVAIGDDDDKDLEVKVKPKEVKEPTKAPEPAKKTGIQSGGVVNGKAIDLIKPQYPAPAKAVGAKGKVEIQVLIDEDGKVVSASVASGHPLLRAAALNAARATRFSPTTLSGQKVKVNGILIYNFTF